jgi:hypothetical protein
MGTSTDRSDDDRSSLSLMLPGAAGGVTRALVRPPRDCQCPMVLLSMLLWQEMRIR